MEPVLPEGRSVLIVEDCPDTAFTLERLIHHWGHPAVIARNGSEALALAQSLRPAVVLLDIGLPGMDGWEVAKQLGKLASGEQARLVVLSGYGQEDDQRRSREAGCHLHLTKPVEPGQLHSLLDTLLSRNAPACRSTNPPGEPAA